MFPPVLHVKKFAEKFVRVAYTYATGGRPTFHLRFRSGESACVARRIAAHWSDCTSPAYYSFWKHRCYFKRQLVLPCARRDILKHSTCPQIASLNLCLPRWITPRAKVFMTVVTTVPEFQHRAGASMQALSPVRKRRWNVGRLPVA